MYIYSLSLGILDPSQVSDPPGNVADMPVLYGLIKKQISQAWWNLIFLFTHRSLQVCWL